MLAHEWRRVCGAMETHLLDRKEALEERFWHVLWESLTREELSSELPPAVAQSPESKSLVDSFVGNLDAAKEKVTSARNPYQAPNREHLAEEVLRIVRAMWLSADKLTTTQRTEAKRYLEAINNYVDALLHEVEDLPPDTGIVRHEGVDRAPNKPDTSTTTAVWRRDAVGARRGEAEAHMLANPRRGAKE